MHRHLYVIISAQCIRDSFLNFGVLEKFMKLFPSGLYTEMSSCVSSFGIRNYKIFIPHTELLSKVLIKTYQVSASISVEHSSAEVLNLEVATPSGVA